MTNYEAVWQVFADLVTELRRAGETVSSQVVRDLRSAKTMIQISKVDRDNPDHLVRIEELIRSIESCIMPKAEKRFGREAVAEWEERLEKARGEVHEESLSSRRFVPGVPRNKDWVRIETTDDIPLEKVVQAAGEEGLICKTDGDQWVIVYGEKTGIKNLIDRLTEYQKTKRSAKSI
ncbi:MAG: DUF2096 family protein [Nitrososphaerota archaeon]